MLKQFAAEHQTSQYSRTGRFIFKESTLQSPVLKLSEIA